MKDITVTREALINYLQHDMDKAMSLLKDYGSDDERVQSHISQLIGAKELAEAIIQEPVNLQKDGKVTVGF